jgi:hypothetical protein
MRVFNHFDDWKEQSFICTTCKWQGLGIDLKSGDLKDEYLVKDCPICGEELIIVSHGTFEEAEANMVKMTESEIDSYKMRKEFVETFESQQLKDPKQLPDIDSPAFVLDWDFEPAKPHNKTLIKYGGTTIFTEIAAWESYERFIQVAEIIRARYGAAVRDLVPTKRSEPSLGGDCLSAFQKMDDARKRIFKKN